MKIAVTADLHLTSMETHPQRFRALEILLAQLAENKTDTLILAGDLFDAEVRNAAELERILNQEACRHMRILVLPGNHDSWISGRMLAAPHVEVVEKPCIRRFGDSGLPVCLLPYEKEKTMGDCLGTLAADLPPGAWILIGHGDRVEGMREVNPLEPGTYMPLTRSDMEQFKPAAVILGHIHKPTDQEGFHYTGSLYPLDPSETGPRRYLILDTESGRCTSRFIDTGLICMREDLVVLPVDKEAEVLIGDLETRTAEWNLPAEGVSRLQVSLRIRGYSADKSRLFQALSDWLKGREWGSRADLNMDDVFISQDPEKAEIARYAAQAVEELEWPDNPDEPGRSRILMEALHVIYGDG